MSHYSMIIQWSEEDQAFIVTLPEFDCAMTHGDTYEEAVREGKDLIDSFILWYEQDGKTLPEPAKPSLIGAA
jgi:predicted RNase H-like HicB family nuclease